MFHHAPPCSHNRNNFTLQSLLLKKFLYLQDLQSFHHGQQGANAPVEYVPPENPEESISDRVFFLFNNVSKSNAKEKSAELCEVLNEGVLPWFAYYIVCKRITVEQSFHELFATVLDFVQEKLPKVRPHVQSELIRSIKVCI